MKKVLLSLCWLGLVVLSAGVSEEEEEEEELGTCEAAPGVSECSGGDEKGKRRNVKEIPLRKVQNMDIAMLQL